MKNFLLIEICILFLLTSCGQAGRLYLPAQTNQANKIPVKETIVPQQKG